MGIRARIAALGYYSDGYKFFGMNDEIMQFTLYADELQRHRCIHLLLAPAFLESKTDEELLAYIQTILDIFNAL